MATLLAAFQRQRPGFQFVDVGANMGLYSAICAVMFDPGRVVAFEPTPDVAEVARRVLAANQVSTDIGWVEQCALGEHPGTVPLYLSAVSDSSNSLVAGFKQSVGSIDVTVTTLDDYVDATGTVPAIVKIDTETFEPAVINGARATLRTLPPVAGRRGAPPARARPRRRVVGGDGRARLFVLPAVADVRLAPTDHDRWRAGEQGDGLAAHARADRRRVRRRRSALARSLGHVHG